MSPLDIVLPHLAGGLVVSTNTADGAAHPLVRSLSHLLLVLHPQVGHVERTLPNRADLV